MPTNDVDRVYLARHGRTALNADGGLRGLSDPPLDEVGQVEAKRLTKALAAFGDIDAPAHLRVVIRETKQPTLEYLSLFAKFTRSLADPYCAVRWLGGKWTGRSKWWR